MKHIYVKGSKPKTHPFPIVSWLIRLFTWSKYSHTLLDFNNGLIFHINFNVSSYEALNHFDTTDETIKIIKLSFPDEYYSKLIKRCDKEKGRQNGYFPHVIGIALILPFRLFNIHLNNPFQKYYNSKTCSMFISELMIDVLKIDTFINSKIKVPNFTEKDVIELLEKAPPFKNGIKIEILK